jgi:serine/threonine-protein kinase
MGDTPVAVASKHVRENPPTPREINPSVPPDLEAIILKCLAKSPEYRYATGDDLRVDLLRFREGRAVGAVAPPMMAPPTMGSTQAIPFSGTQTLSQIPGLDTDEPEKSRTGLYAVLLVVLLVALAVVILFLGQSLGWWHIGSGNDTVTITDLSGQTVTAAEHTLSQQGLKYTVHPDPSSSVSNKKVIRTLPGAGAKVKKGSNVELVTGGSGSLIQVQSYKDESVSQAEQAVKALGLQAKVQPAALCSQAFVNIVCSQNPSAGARLAPGKTVTLFTAPTQTTTTTAATSPVPGVAGDTQTQACNAINGAGFSCGSTSTTASNLPVNSVVSTTPAAGSLQPKGTTINLVLSSGPSTVVVQSVVGDTQGTAETTLTAQGLTPIVNCQATTDSTQDGIVQSQSPGAGQTVSLPASVTITVDSLSGCGTTTTAPPG